MLNFWHSAYHAIKVRRKWWTLLLLPLFLAAATEWEMLTVTKPRIPRGPRRPGLKENNKKGEHKEHVTILCEAVPIPAQMLQTKDPASTFLGEVGLGL